MGLAHPWKPESNDTYGGWTTWGQSTSHDGRSNVQRVAETLFEYIDVGGHGHINARLIRAAAEMLSPETFDERLRSSPTLVDILIPHDLGDKQMPCREYTKAVPAT